MSGDGCCGGDMTTEVTLPDKVPPHGGPDAGASPRSLQPVEIPAAGALEGGGEGNGLESGQVSEGADI